MVKIDLITGFLGAGKTTFLKKYARYCMDKGENICILENDFGAVNIDMMLLQDILGDHCDMEMVAGGCDKHCHIRRFKTKLIAMGMCGYQRVIVEPSGIFDVDEFFDVLREDPLERWYEIDNVITIVDAGIEEKLSEGADYLLGSQIANAGSIVFSKVETMTRSQEDLMNQIKASLAKIKCKRNLDKLEDHTFWKEWKDYNEEDFQKISSGGYVLSSYEKKVMEEEDIFSSLYFMNKKISLDKLKAKIDQLFHDQLSYKDGYGQVIRVKGFLPDEVEEESWIKINATKGGTEVEKIDKGQEVLIVIGESLNKKAIEDLFEQ